MSNQRVINQTTLAQRTPIRGMNLYIRDLVKQIDAAVSAAHEELSKNVVFVLPVNMNFTGIKLKDAQVYVYSELLKIYNTPEPEGRGLSASLDISDGNVNLIISWPEISIMNESERIARKNIISRFTRK